MTTQQQQFSEYATILKNNGFNVYVSANNDINPTHGFIVKDNKIGYIQSEKFGGIRFSTVHKPNKYCGTGFSLNDYLDSESNPTIKHAESTLVFAPNWASSLYRNHVVKYKNWDEYKNSSLNKSTEYREF